MNPIVMKMLAEARMLEANRQVEIARSDERRGSSISWITLALAGLLVAAALEAGWIA